MSDFAIIAVSLLLSVGADVIWFVSTGGASRLMEQKIHKEVDEKLSEEGLQQKLAECEKALQIMKRNLDISTEETDRLSRVCDELRKALEQGTPVPNDQSTAIKRLEQRLSALEQQKPPAPQYDVSAIVRRLEALERQMAEQQPSRPAAQIDYGADIKGIHSRLDALDQKVTKFQSTQPDRSMEQRLSTYEQQLKAYAAQPDYSMQMRKMLQRLDALEQSLKGSMNLPPEMPVSQKAAPPEPAPEKPAVIRPDEAYLEAALRHAAGLKGILLQRDYDGLCQEFRECLREFDDDAEETMSGVHHAIEKYVAGSFTKVTADQRLALHQYLEALGYRPAPIKAGDSIREYSRFFSNMSKIENGGGAQWTIRAIQIPPYQITYADAGEEETLILRGWCTYYG